MLQEHSPQLQNLAKFIRPFVWEFSRNTLDFLARSFIASFLKQGLQIVLHNKSAKEKFPFVSKPFEIIYLYLKKKIYECINVNTHFEKVKQQKLFDCIYLN